jgi:hypothetical protein
MWVKEKQKGVAGTVSQGELAQVLQKKEIVERLGAVNGYTMSVVRVGFGIVCMGIK